MAKLLRIGFVGAGNVNFGGGEGPWDHATRLEQIEGLCVVGVADPSVERASQQIRRRSHPLFKGAKAYSDYRDLIREQRPDALWIGVPPNAHGTAVPGRNIEIQCAEAGIHMFVEKPLSSAKPCEVRPVLETLEDSGLIVSVGYMFRYAEAVAEMKRIIDETPGGVKAFVGRYNCAYSEIRKAEWWDVRQSGGPIVEQATHFLDLARYLCGNVDLTTVRTQTIQAGEVIAEMVDIPLGSNGRSIDCGVPQAFKHPRSTVSIWKFKTGAVGSLSHSTWLHGERYHTGLEVWGDGLYLALEDPYGDCRLSVRKPHSDRVEVMKFEDDPYLLENRAFVEAVRTGDPSAVRSSYADAYRTFELTWAMA